LKYLKTLYLPVCKEVTDYNRSLLFEQEEKSKEIKKATPSETGLVKEIRFRPNTSDHDFDDFLN